MATLALDLQEFRLPAQEPRRQQVGPAYPLISQRKQGVRLSTAGEKVASALSGQTLTSELNPKKRRNS